MNHRGRSPGHLASARSHGSHLDEATSQVVVSHPEPEEVHSKMVFSITSALAAATADDAFAVAGVAGVPHSSFAVSPSHRLDSTAPSENTSLGNSIFYDDQDVADGTFSSDPVLTHEAIERIQQKILYTKDKIRLEQEIRDENVNEFLKLCANADRQQQNRMKQLFEKKNQKSAQNISYLQRKLEDYFKRLKEIEERGVQQKPSHKMRDKVQGLKNVGGNIRDTVMSKPKEFAHLLRHKFGSADNLNAVEAAESEPRKGSSSLPRDNTGPRRSLHSNDHHSSIEDHKCLSEDGAAVVRRKSVDVSEKSDATSESVPPVREVPQSNSLDRSGTTEWKAVMQELNLQKEEVDRLREEIYEYRQQCKLELEHLHDQLREERERFERLEEQMNDLTELHQHEIENINSGVKDMEEKVQYQSEERLLDIKEHLQGLETKLNSLEHQQAQQQYINIEGLDSSDARAIFMKLLTAVITVIHVGLFFVGTFLSFAKPFFRTKGRFSITTLVLVVSFGIYQQQETLNEFFIQLTQKFGKHGDESDVSAETKIPK